MPDYPAPARPKKPGRVTVRDVKRYPWYYIAGPGRDAADRSHCDHHYRLTDSCPICD